MVIELQHVSYVIGNHTIFQDVNATVDGGSLVAITGPSGSGKTSLLNVMSLLSRPAGGDVIIDGVSTLRWGDRRRRAFWKDKVSFVYQDYGLIDEETVIYNLTFKRRIRNAKNAEIPRRLSRLLDETGMTDRVNEPVAVLSGGEKQRVAIARALWKRSVYVFADEPTASLDEDNRRIIVELLKKTARQGACVVVSTHDSELVNACDQTISLVKAFEERRESSPRHRAI